MKTSILSLLTCATFAAAQAPPNFPPCGSGTMLPAISATGCGFTDATCLCKNASFKDTLVTKIPKVCPSPTDVAFYAKFINEQCTGQPGFPLTLGEAAPPSSGSAPAPASAAGAAPSAAAPAAPATPASAGTHNNAAATTAGTAKPATFTGSAASRNMVQGISSGMVAVALGFVVLGF